MVWEAIESVLAQRHRPFELIVVDDGSDDETAEEIRRRHGRSVRVVSEAHRGVAAARNLGVRNSAGPYLAFLDSDDTWRPGKLAAQVAFMQGDARAEICQTEEIWIRNGRRINPKLRHRKPSGDLFRASLELCLVSPSAVLMTRGLFDRVGGFDESFPVCEDYDLWLRISRDTPIHLIPEPLVIKRGGHVDQLSRSTWGFDRFRALSIKKLLDAGLPGDKRRWAVEALARKVRVLANGARKRKREGEALAYEALVADFIGELSDGRRGHSSLLPAQGLS
jgi:GT2 family glycosyltransferase